MKSFRRFAVENKFSKLATAPGGIRAMHAVQRAEENIEQSRDAYLVVLDEKIDCIAALGASVEAEQAAIYRTANEVFAEAGAYGLKELSAVAHNLCSLTTDDRPAPTQAMVAVHVDAMRALRRPELAGSPEARAAVLAGLKDLTRRAAAR
ncbi:MAG: hypothetical protein GC189_08710 [Alphaproteobacteria bacterium]|nr:hypothetical protein [Alphaproteobacteria bacterium]